MAAAAVASQAENRERLQTPRACYDPLLPNSKISGIDSPLS